MRPGGAKVAAGPVRPGSGAALAVVFAAAILEQQDTCRPGDSGQCLDGLLAPFRHHAFVTKADSQAEQLAGIGDRGGRAVGEQLVENALIAGETVADRKSTRLNS